jgi:hypothetical protein
MIDSSHFYLRSGWNSRRFSSKYSKIESFVSRVSVVENSRVHLTSSNIAPEMHRKDPSFAHNSER